MRKQGLFFILAAVAVGLMFAFEIAQISGVKFFPHHAWELLLLAIISGLVPLVLAFLPSRRNIQLRFGAAVSAVMLGFIGFVVYYVIKALNLPEGAVGFGAVMPLLALIFNILAIRAVISDMKIIRDSNRLR